MIFRCYSLIIRLEAVLLSTYLDGSVLGTRSGTQLNRMNMVLRPSFRESPKAIIRDDDLPPIPCDWRRTRSEGAARRTWNFSLKLNIIREYRCTLKGKVVQSRIYPGICRRNHCHSRQDFSLLRFVVFGSKPFGT